MTTEQKLIKKVVAAADEYADSAEFTVDETNSPEMAKWWSAFNELREYTKTIADE